MAYVNHFLRSLLFTWWSCETLVSATSGWTPWRSPHPASLASIVPLFTKALKLFKHWLLECPACSSFIRRKQKICFWYLSIQKLWIDSHICLGIFNKKVQNCHLHNAATSKVGFEFSNLQRILKRAEVWPVEPMKWATKRDSRYESTILNFPNLKIKRHSIGWAIHLLNGEYFVTICQGSWRPLWSRYLRFWITAN